MKSKPSASPRESNPQPAPLPEPENRPETPQNEGSEGGGTSQLSNEEMKRPARH